MTGTARTLAALISAVAWSGLAIQFVALLEVNGSVRYSLATMFVYFTITTNLLVAIVLTGVAMKSRILTTSSAVAGTAISILLVGVVYHVLLRGLRELSGGSAVADIMLHRMTPALLPMYWFVFVPRGRLRWIDPGFWAVYPITYLIYALVWGSLKRHYPYPFLDALQLGWERVLWNVAAITVLYLGASFSLVFLDQRLVRHWHQRSSAL